MQKYTEIPSSTTLADSLPLILNNDKSAISCHSGTTFPTTDLQVGMLCYRTDLKKLYILVDIVKEKWAVVTDGTGDGYLLAGKNGTAINYSKKNLDSWEDMPTGFYQGIHMLNAPKSDVNWRVLQFREDNTSGWATQLAFGANNKSVCVRFETGGSWSDWYDIAMSKEGKVSEGLNSDRLRDLFPSNESGQIPINNTKLNKNLNADMLDGLHASNEAESVPISNTKLNYGLNADMLHGHKAGNGKENIPVNNGKVCIGLNAEMINGVKVDRILNFNQDNYADREIGLKYLHVDTLDVKEFQLKNFTESKHQKFTVHLPSSSHGTISGDEVPFDGDKDRKNWRKSYGQYIYNRYENYEFLTTPANIKAGAYSIYEIIQKLVDVSHSHKANGHYSWISDNCKCDCRCECGDDGA